MREQWWQTTKRNTAIEDYCQAIGTYLRKSLNCLPLDGPPWLQLWANSQRVLCRWSWTQEKRNTRNHLRRLFSFGNLSMDTMLTASGHISTWCCSLRIAWTSSMSSIHNTTSYYYLTTPVVTIDNKRTSVEKDVWDNDKAKSRYLGPHLPKLQIGDKQWMVLSTLETGPFWMTKAQREETRDDQILEEEKNARVHEGRAT